MQHISCHEMIRKYADEGSFPSENSLTFTLLKCIVSQDTNRNQPD